MRQKAENRRFPCEGDWFVAVLDDVLTFTATNGATYTYPGEVPHTLEGMLTYELCEMLGAAVRWRRGSRYEKEHTEGDVNATGAND